MPTGLSNARVGKTWFQDKRTERSGHTITPPAASTKKAHTLYSLGPNLQSEVLSNNVTYVRAHSLNATWLLRNLQRINISLYADPNTSARGT